MVPGFPKLAKPSPKRPEGTLTFDNCPRALCSIQVRVTWIGGWGTPPDALRPVAEEFCPGAEHTFLAPVAGAAETTIDSDLAIGWSLGAWHLLEAAAAGQRFRGNVILLAPFVAFCAEHGLGGRCSLTQVRWLRRWIQREPIAALQDFYARAGLGNAADYLPFSMPQLIEGLDRLAQDGSPALRTFVQRGLPANWTAMIGSADPLLDSTIIARCLPGCQIAAGAGHCASDLIRHVEEPVDAV